MIPGYWFAGDAAYVLMPGLITPWSKYDLMGDERIFADSFNFFHSSHRIHVEQAFGILVARWGILWRPLKFHIDEVLPIISCTMRLHNFCIDNDGIAYVKQAVNTFEQEVQDEAFNTWWETAVSLRADLQSNQGMRRDKESSALRQALTNSLKARGITRPALC